MEWNECLCHDGRCSDAGAVPLTGSAGKGAQRLAEWRRLGVTVDGVKELGLTTGSRLEELGLGVPSQAAIQPLCVRTGGPGLGEGPEPAGEVGQWPPLSPSSGPTP